MNRIVQSDFKFVSIKYHIWKTRGKINQSKLQTLDEIHSARYLTLNGVIFIIREFRELHLDTVNESF